VMEGWGVRRVGGCERAGLLGVYLITWGGAITERGTGHERPDYEERPDREEERIASGNPPACRKML
jgi:hypothetical protein